MHDKKAANEVSVNQGGVARAGRGARGWYWVSQNGLTNTYQDEGKFFMSLRDAGIRMNEASRVVSQLKAGGRQASLFEAVQKLATDNPEFRKHLVPLLRQAAKPQIAWRNLQLVAGHRKALTNILETLDALSGGNVKALKPGDEGYDWVKAKYKGGNNVSGVRGLKGKVTTKGGRKLFVGTVTGIGEVILAQINFKQASVELPSEEQGGKPSYDADFKAGYLAGKAAYQKNDQVSSADGARLLKRVRGHGSWFEDGYSAAIDVARGAYATNGAQIAKKMKLAGLR